MFASGDEFDFGDANVILEAHNIREILANQEERQFLAQQNPDLLIAYEALVRLGNGSRK